MHDNDDTSSPYPSRPRRNDRPGIITYIIILIVVFIVVIIVLAMVGPAIGNVYSGFGPNI